MREVVRGLIIAVIASVVAALIGVWVNRLGLSVVLSVWLATFLSILFFVILMSWEDAVWVQKSIEKDQLLAQKMANRQPSDNLGLSDSVIIEMEKSQVDNDPEEPLNDSDGSLH